MMDTYTMFSKTTSSFLLGFLSCVMFSSCGPSKDESALEVFCRTEGPQLSNTRNDSDVSKKDCYFYGNSIYLYSIDVYTDKKRIIEDYEMNIERFIKEIIPKDHMTKTRFLFKKDFFSEVTINELVPNG